MKVVFPLIRKSFLCVVLLALAHPASGAWQPLGPFGGHAQSIAVHPMNARLLLVGTKNALLYRSQDAGESWQPLAFPAPLTATINTIAFHPKEAATYYVGVADDGLEGSENGAGVYKSLDAGRHWERLPGVEGRSVFALALWSENPLVLAAGTREGVYRTDDGGRSWRRISPETNPGLQAIMSLAFDPREPDILYAGTPHLPWKTIDGGLNWRPIHQGMIDDSDVFSIRVDPTWPNRVFASACSGIYRSANGGSLWVKLQGIPRSDRRTHIITQDPQRPEIVYAGTSLGLWKSIDGGGAWRKMCDHAVKSIAFDPTNGQILYLATDRSGILKSNDGGQTLAAVNHGFFNRTITQFSIAAAHGRADQKTLLYAATIYEGEFGGLFKSESGGKNWSLLANQKRLLGQNLVSLAVSAAHPQRLFGASYEGLLQSTDGGHTWQQEKPKPSVETPEKAGPSTEKKRPVPQGRQKPPIAPNPPPAVTGPAMNGRVYALKSVWRGKPWLLAGTSAGLFYSEEDPSNWHSLPIVDGESMPVYALYLPAAGLHSMGVLTPRGIFLSDNEGRSWRRVEFPFPREVVYELALHPNRPSRLLAATTRGLLLSSDGGQSWFMRGGGLPVAPVTAVVWHPLRSEEAYVLQNQTVYRSGDGGESWQPIDSAGLEDASVRSLIISPEMADQLFALSVSRGIFAKQLKE